MLLNLRSMKLGKMKIKIIMTAAKRNEFASKIISDECREIRGTSHETATNRVCFKISV